MKFLRKQNFYEFFKSRIFRQGTTDFETRTMRQSLFLDMDHKAIPVRSKFSPFCNQKFPKKKKKKKKMKLSDWSLHSCTKKCTGVFPLHTMSTIVFLGHSFLFHSEDFISHLSATFLVLLTHKLVSLVTFLSHGYSVIQISNFFIQTGSVGNGWKLLAAK